MIERLWRSFRLLLLVLLVCGLILRVTGLRDSVDILAPLYYATPWPVLGFLSALAAFPFFRKRSRRWILRTFLLLLCLGIWLKPTLDKGVHNGTSADLRVLFWNLQQKPHLNRAMVDILIGQRPDIAVFVERGGELDKAIDEYRRIFPGYTIEGLDNLMLVFCRGEIVDRQNVNLTSRNRYNRIEVLVDRRSYVIYAVDIDPNVFLSRREPLEAIRAAAAKETGPTIIAGDFNTPFESAHFDAYRESFHHSFQDAGSGMMETWPYFFNLLSIDHIWSSAHLRAVETHKVSAGFTSDHAAIVTGLSAAGQEAAARVEPPAE